MAARVRLVEENKNISWEVALEEFILWKQANGLSKRTLDDYQLHVNMFFKRFPKSLQSDELSQSAYQYMSDKIKPATYNLRLIYLRAFFQWCIERGHIKHNPVKDLKKRKEQNRIVNIEDDLLKELLSRPDKTTFVGLRDYALILLTLDTGIRPNEAFSLTEKDFNLKHLSMTITAESAKTRNERVLPILSVTSEPIKKLICARHLDWGKDTPVFCTYDGKRMSRYTWNDRLDKYSKLMGGAKIRPYDLRHCFALMYLRNGGHAFGLQKMLGHSDLNMTRRYLNLTGQDLKEIHVKVSPLNNLIIKQKGKRVIKLT